jgi:hypothetical protein
MQLDDLNRTVSYEEYCENIFDNVISGTEIRTRNKIHFGELSNGEGYYTPVNRSETERNAEYFEARNNKNVAKKVKGPQKLSAAIDMINSDWKIGIGFSYLQTNWKTIAPAKIADRCVPVKLEDGVLTILANHQRDVRDIEWENYSIISSVNEILQEYNMNVQHIQIEYLQANNANTGSSTKEDFDNKWGIA